jgi:signal peptidase
MFRKYLGRYTKLAGQIVGIAIITFVGVLCLLHFIFGFGFYVVKSGSMEPKIHVGDTIITMPFKGTSAGTLNIGDVISFQDGKALTSHRIISINGDSIITKGDANEDADPRPVGIAQVKGIYLFKIPYIGYVSYFIHTKLGWFLLIIVPAFILFCLIIVEIIKETFKSKPVEGQAIAGRTSNSPAPHDRALH